MAHTPYFAEQFLLFVREPVPNDLNPLAMLSKPETIGARQDWYHIVHFDTVHLDTLSKFSNLDVFNYAQLRLRLVGGLEHFFIFHFIYGTSSFPLTFIFFKVVGQPPTSHRIG